MKSLFKALKYQSVGSSKPRVSVVVIAYNMAREIPRTVSSLLPPYQTGLDGDDVEVIVLDNGSPHPVDSKVIASWPANVRYEFVTEAKPSPAQALNYGVELARSDFVGVVIDGARMVTPGVLSQALQARALHERAVIATLGFHLGPKPQQISTQEGYDQAEEDRLLDQIDWINNGYDLFLISALGQSARLGWFNPIAESNAVFLDRALYQEIGGYDEAFAIPGGGIVNLDFFKRLTEDPRNQYILLYGEGSFHQHHGGVTTSSSVTKPDETHQTMTKWERYLADYKAIRGVDYDFPRRDPILFGVSRPQMMPVIERIGDEYKSARAQS